MTGGDYTSRPHQPYHLGRPLVPGCPECDWQFLQLGRTTPPPGDDAAYHRDLQTQLDAEFPEEGAALDISVLRFQLANRTRQLAEAQAEVARLKAHAPTVLGYVGVYPMHDVYLLAATTVKPTLAAAVETLGTAGIPTAVVRVDEEGRIA